MGTSIKLNDEKYIDSTGVYDSTLGMTQNSINSNTACIRSKATANYGTLRIRVSRYLDKSHLFIVGNANNATCVSLIINQNTVLNLGSRQLSCSSYTATSDYFEYVVTNLAGYGTYNIITYGRILSIETI